MLNGKNSDPRNQRTKKFVRGWRQAFYSPFGEESREKIYMPGNLDEEITLWLGEHPQHGRDRAKADFLFLSGLKEIFERLFINQEPFYTSSNGVVMAVRDQRLPNPPAKIIFPVFESRPQEYEIPRWKIVEAIRVMEGLDKIRNGASADKIEKPAEKSAQEVPSVPPPAPEPVQEVSASEVDEKSEEIETPEITETAERGAEARALEVAPSQVSGKENNAPVEQTKTE